MYAHKVLTQTDRQSDKLTDSLQHVELCVQVIIDWTGLAQCVREPTHRSEFVDNGQWTVRARLLTKETPHSRK